MLKDNFSIEQTRKALKKTNPVSTVVIIFLLMQIPGVIFAPLFSYVFLGNDNSDYFLLFNLFLTIFVAILGYIFATKYQKRNKESLGLINNSKNYLKGILIGLLMILSVVLLLKISGFATFTINISQVSWPIFVIFILGWAIQGFEEELITRSILMNYFAVNNGVMGGIIINSLIFAILHLGNPAFGILPFINIMLIGIVFSLLFYISDDIFLPAAAHSFWNFAQGNIFGIEVSGMDEISNTILKTKLMGSDLISGGAFGFEGSIFVTIVEIIVILLLIKEIKYKNLYKKEKENK